MLQMGVIEPSAGEWASPIILVPKKDGSMRFCADYRALNEVTIKDVYPIPRIDDILEMLSGSEYFCTLDLASCYWQVPLAREDREDWHHHSHGVVPFLCATFRSLQCTWNIRANDGYYAHRDARHPMHGILGRCGGFRQDLQRMQPETT